MSNIFFQGGENFSRGSWPPALPWLRACTTGHLLGYNFAITEKVPLNEKKVKKTLFEFFDKNGQE